MAERVEPLTDDELSHIVGLMAESTVDGPTGRALCHRIDSISLALREEREKSSEVHRKTVDAIERFKMAVVERDARIRELEQGVVRLWHPSAVAASTPQPAPKQGDGRCVHDELVRILGGGVLWPNIQLRQAAELAIAVGRVSMRELRNDILARKQMGLAKYGTTLQPHNGRDARVDAYQELLDACCYLMQAKMEADAPVLPDEKEGR